VNTGGTAGSGRAVHVTVADRIATKGDQNMRLDDPELTADDLSFYHG
jgi:hypothetical protein